MRESRITSVLALLALVATGCAGASKGVTEPQAANGASVLTRSGKAASVPFAAEGTAFQARLDQPLDTRLSSPGQRVSATLTQPIRGSDGSVLVPAGAQLEGKIASIDHVNGPNIVLAFDSVKTRSGTIPIGVRVLSAQQERYRTVPNTGVTSMQPSAEGKKQGQEQLSMPKGATVQLALTRPIIQGRALR
jgi:hypothetical protein